MHFVPNVLRWCDALEAELRYGAFPSRAWERGNSARHFRGRRLKPELQHLRIPMLLLPSMVVQKFLGVQQRPEHILDSRLPVATGDERFEHQPTLSITRKARQRHEI